MARSVIILKIAAEPTLYLVSIMVDSEGQGLPPNYCMTSPNLRCIEDVTDCSISLSDSRWIDIMSDLSSKNKDVSWTLNHAFHTTVQPNAFTLYYRCRMQAKLLAKHSQTSLPDTHALHNPEIAISEVLAI